MTTQLNAHPFEVSGLGKAPFDYVGFRQSVGPIEIAPGVFSGAPGQPMGTCAHCGAGIADCYMIRSADGKLSIVGSTCVEKISRSDNARFEDSMVLAIKRAAARVKSERAKVKREIAKANELAQFKAMVARYRAIRETVATLPHSRGWAGRTRADELDWYLDCTSRKTAARELAATLALFA